MMRRLFVFVALAVCILAVTSAEARPDRWCGWWLRHELGVTDTKYDTACAWLDYGSPAAGPAVGTIVIWCGKSHRHVGKIVGTDANGNFIVKSGNDGHAVRERVRSIDGAVFRWP
jgi:hypothetical protein